MCNGKKKSHGETACELKGQRGHDKRESDRSRRREVGCLVYLHLKPERVFGSKVGGTKKNKFHQCQTTAAEKRQV